MRSLKLITMVASVMTTMSLAGSSCVAAPAARTPSRVVTQHTGLLAGRPAGDLYAIYLGSSPMARIPEKISIDGNKALASLWERKVRRSRGNRVVLETRSNLLREYRTLDPQRMTLGEYQRIAADQANLMNRSISWDEFAALYRLKPERMKLVKNIMSRVSGRSLTAYAMTELLPGRLDGAYNRAYFDLLLRSGGRRYVDSIPAIYDTYTSFGPFQFTSRALYDVNGMREGASKANLAVAARVQIPGSVMHLRGNMHIRAAYLFALSNVATGVKNLNNRQFKTLEQVWRRSDEDLLAYIATAHNKPAVARSSLRRWLDNKARLDYLVSTPRASRIYAIKTRTNYRALRPTR